MNGLEDELRRRLNESATPPVRDADGLWSEIESALPPAAADGPPLPPAPRKYSPYRWLIGGVLLLLMAGIIGHRAAVAPPTAGRSEVRAAPTSPQPPGSGGVAGRAREPLAGSSSGAESMGANPGTGAAPQSTPAAGVVVALRPAARQPAPERTVPDRGLARPRASVKAFSPASRTVAGLPASRLPRVVYPVVLPDLSARFTGPSPQEEVFRRRPSRFSAGLFVGSHLPFHRYAGGRDRPLAGSLNAAAGSALGTSLAGEIGYRFGPRLRLSAGLEYGRSHTTFRHTDQRDTTIARPDLPGRPPLPALAIRTVSHNNFRRYLSLPLLLGVSTEVGRVEAGLAVGLSLNYLTLQTGRLLDATGEVVAYSSRDADVLPTSNFFLGYQLRPSLTYRLGRRLSLELRTDLRYQPHGTSGLFGLRHRSVLLGGSVGAVYAW